MEPDENSTSQTLQEHRPDLAGPYLAALPAARAAVMGRLWGALHREGIVPAHRLQSPRQPVLYPGEVPDVTADGTTHTHPARLLQALDPPGNTARLARELGNSTANLALAYTTRQRGPRTGAESLADLEQSVLDGHPLHPCCRTRTGMSTLDVLAYAPEHRPVVELRLVAVDPHRWHTTGAAVPPLLPVHPWQLPRALATGLVTDTGRVVPARPLMSLRTLAPLRSPHLHLKTAVEIQMTSAVRTLSDAAIHNGPLASGLAATLARRTSGLRILQEVAAATVLDDDGAPQRALGAVWRQAPPPGAFVVPLAVLPQRPDLLTPAFFAALVPVLLPPLFDLLHLGVALEAHGQNTLVEIADGRPVRIWYRDLGGLHVHPGRLARAGVQMPPLRGALPTGDEDALRTKLLAAVMATVLTGLVHALHRDGADETRLWDVVGATVRDHVRAEDLATVLADTWPLKATTRMRLADDPLEDLWCTIPNPLR